MPAPDKKKKRVRLFTLNPTFASLIEKEARVELIVVKFIQNGSL